ncbi:tRNA pseudouridine synthase A, mitochondrial isoform X2 [Zootermopsis nevadensis]|uniref:tRNA pseudouridine synthase A, mitochondrial isoform X2 n=1 Tax=Zootermopsis nevadensis TaxID=136037 RepID=UPI000B8E5A3A|nr:tRNA pseudouridine synthase A, mitochondrial isoform X2 [Zootermopsis nevadensis]
MICVSVWCVKEGFVFKLCGLFRTMCDAPPPVSKEGDSKKRPLQEDSDNTDLKKQCVEPDRVKRRKVALLFGYSGQGYLGMQRNPGMKTIEEDLLTALLKANFINEEAFSTPQLIQFQRAARTDKGVSAVRQVVSLKLPEDVKVETINSHLPAQIRILEIKRTTKGFNSKSSCDARTYSYMLPTFAFAPSGVEPSESYRITSEVMDNVRSTLRGFEGTHNFHNFTSRKKPLDPSAIRYIINFELGEPFISKGLEFAVLKVKGQSFMLHQIRKMVGMTIAVARGLATIDTLHKAWKTERLDLPVAPGLGLVLEEVHYGRYNQRFGKDGIHEPLDWSETEAEAVAFKENFIYPTIIQSEIEDKSMMSWLETLHLHSYCIREDNLSHGLETLGEAVDMIQGIDDGDRLATLARVAQVVQEGQNVMCNGNSNQYPSEGVSSP